jgi:cation diffusion facilitator family transporter
MSKANTNNHSTNHIVQSLLVNLIITAIKAVAAVMTKSGSMLAETIHSFADCGNQGLLLLGVKQAQRPPDSKHPLGYGRNVYFWSFMVAMLLFSLGGMFSIYEGFHKINHPSAVENVKWGVVVLLVSLCLEGYAAYSNIVELNKRRKSVSFFRFLKETKDSDLVVIFGENSAAVLGLAIALVALLVAFYTGDGRYDGYGSLAIGLILVSVSIFLAKELKPLIIGESGDIVLSKKVTDLVTAHPEINHLLNCVTIQQGPGEVLMCIKIECIDNLSSKGISSLINNFEMQIRRECPEVRWLFIEPDIKRV